MSEWQENVKRGVKQRATSADTAASKAAAISAHPGAACGLYFRWISQTHSPQSALHLIPTTIIMSACCTRLELVFANLLLRLWIGMRLVMAGLDKFRAGEGTGTTFSVANYEAKTERIAQLTWEKGFLPEELCRLYAQPLGYLLIAAGIWAVIGLFSRLGLLFAGFMFLSLGLGLATLPDDTEVVLIGVQVLICAAALGTNAHNKISLDGLFFRGKKPTECAPPAAPATAAE